MYFSVIFLPCCFLSQPVQQDGLPGLAAPAAAQAAGGVWAGGLELVLPGHECRRGRAGGAGCRSAAGRHAGAHPQVVAGLGAGGCHWGALKTRGAAGTFPRSLSLSVLPACCESFLCGSEGKWLEGLW